MTAEPVKICPQCNGEVIRLIGPGAGPIFKGNGFYQTDYKNPPKKETKNKNEKAANTGNKSAAKPDKKS